MRDFWRRLKFMITGGRHNLPPEAINVVNQFKTLIVQYAQREHVDWFGKLIVWYIGEFPDSVKYRDGVLIIDVKITSPVPGDWGDEMFDAMYSLEEALMISKASRFMYTVPDDYNLPPNLRSNEHFVGVHWMVCKRINEGK